MTDTAEPTFQSLDLADGEVLPARSFFSPAEADRLLAALLTELPWGQEQISLFGRTQNVPRLVAWHGDAGKTYTYSGVVHVPQPWTPALLTIKQAIEPLSGVTFNSVLANRYRDQTDSMGWHSDDEPELGDCPVIGSVSLGATRTFQLRHKRDKALRLSVDLEHGSYLLMRGHTQENWLHQVPKRQGQLGQRVNLTFRVIY